VRVCRRLGELPGRPNTRLPSFLKESTAWGSLFFPPLSGGIAGPLWTGEGLQALGRAPLCPLSRLPAPLWCSPDWGFWFPSSLRRGEVWGGRHAKALGGSPPSAPGLVPPLGGATLGRGLEVLVGGLHAACLPLTPPSSLSLSSPPGRPGGAFSQEMQGRGLTTRVGACPVPLFLLVRQAAAVLLATPLCWHQVGLSGGLRVSRWGG